MDSQREIVLGRADYSYEVVHYEDVGYRDSLANAGNEISVEDERYDWLRVTMVSHNGNEMTFGNGAGTQTELVKFHFKIDDVVDNFAPRSFRVPTLYSGQTGYYTYVTDGFYAADYKLYIDMEMLELTKMELEMDEVTSLYILSYWMLKDTLDIHRGM